MKNYFNFFKKFFIGLMVLCLSFFYESISFAGNYNHNEVPANNPWKVMLAPTIPDDNPMLTTGNGIMQYKGDILNYDPHAVGLQNIKVWSAAMSRYIPFDVIVPLIRKKPTPVLYLVNGADGGEGVANWKYQSDYAQFFANKGIIVVQVMQGEGSFYTDWRYDDPRHGKNKWETFLVHEVEKTFEPYLNINPKRRGLIGYSMSVPSVYSLQIARPGFYKAVHAYSGCPEVFSNTPPPTNPKWYSSQYLNPNYLAPRHYVMAIVSATGGFYPNMWGYPDQDPANWKKHDPVINAAKLRGTDLYIYSGNGKPGKHDILNDPTVRNPARNEAALQNTLRVGGELEERGYVCTKHFVRKLHSLNIPIVTHYGNGTHSWGYWIDSLHHSWPYMARSLGVNP